MDIGVLSHVGLVVDDIEGARRLFEEIFALPGAGYPDEEAYAIRAGDTILRLVPPHFPEAAVGHRGIHHLALHVDSLGRVREDLQKLGIPVLTDHVAGSCGAEALWTDPGYTSGVLLQFMEHTENLDFPQAPADGLIEKIDHIAVIVRDNKAAQHTWVDLFGFALESSQIDTESLIPVEVFSSDKYGTIYHSRAPQVVAGGIHSIYVTVGDFELQIFQTQKLANEKRATEKDGGSTQQDQSTIARFLEKKGEGMAHIAFCTPDIQHALDTVAERGIKLIDSTPRPGSRAGRIGFLDLHSTQRILFEFVQRGAL